MRREDRTTDAQRLLKGDTLEASAAATVREQREVEFGPIGELTTNPSYNLRNNLCGSLSNNTSINLSTDCRPKKSSATMAEFAATCLRAACGLSNASVSTCFANTPKPAAEATSMQ